ncbi:hypothetical protein [Hirschia litorea]|uniref:Uncharacterized protein n=1 Tax=Hirschia litorea TaxID=1199156 RepID=A0ABW2IGW7_9PROT
MKTSDAFLDKYDVTLFVTDTPVYFDISASFDEGGKLTISKGNKDDDWYLHISKGETPALKRVLDKTCKPRIHTGDANADTLAMLKAQFGGERDAFENILKFLDNRGVKYTQSHWIGSDQ